MKLTLMMFIIAVRYILINALKSWVKLKIPGLNIFLVISYLSTSLSRENNLKRVKIIDKKRLRRNKQKLTKMMMIKLILLILIIIWKETKIKRQHLKKSKVIIDFSLVMIEFNKVIYRIIEWCIFSYII